MFGLDLNPYTTARKVLAVGARICETGLKVCRTPSEGQINKPRYTRCERRVMFRRMRRQVAVPGYGPICLDTKDPETVYDSFCSRLLRQVPVIDPQQLADFRRFVQKQLADVPQVDVTKVDFEKWLTKTSYNQARQDELRRAYESLRGGLPSKKQCSNVSAFGKTESYVEYKHMRMINSRGDAFKAWAGPYIHALEKVVYGHFPEFVKHTTIEQRAERVRALRRDGALYYCTDYTSFECGFSPRFMEVCENALFRHSLGAWKGCGLLCRTNAGQNRMRTRIGCAAKVNGRRMSGDMWTSLGNGFANLMIARYQAYLAKADMSALIEGDDALIATTKALDPSIYAKLGFIIKIDQVQDPCKASFCGLIFSDSGQIIREPRRFLSTFGWTHSCVYGGDLIMDELLLAKTLSGLQETPQCPIIGAMLRTAYELTHRLNPRFVHDGYHKAVEAKNVEVEPFSPTLDTRALFEEMYGISVSSQLEIERLIRAGQLSDVEKLLSPSGAMADYVAKYLEVH